jgi:formyltetrahydrofolate-dependent phosphoribosylglycinamide formyltransferase
VKKIVVFASGSGTNFQAVIDNVLSGNIQAEITGLIADRKGIMAIERAKKYKIPVEIIPADPPESFSRRLLTQLTKWDPDLIVLAGYLKKIPDRIVTIYRRKIINIHPALLPKHGGKGYYGRKVHQAVLDSGEKETGCSVHYVDEEYDRGPVIGRRIVPVYSSDTADSLASRVLKAEHQLLPTVIKKLLHQNFNK